MKILKDNLWNVLFHHKELRKQRSLYWESKALISNYPRIKKNIEDSVDLFQLLMMHKEAWVYGFRNDNLGPCEYGMFRTKSIPDMTSSEVYLGNINGLWTFTLKEWQNKRGSEDYNLIVFQYKNLLLSNIKAIERDAQECVFQYEMQNLRS